MIGFTLTRIVGSSSAESGNENTCWASELSRDFKILKCVSRASLVFTVDLLSPLSLRLELEVKGRRLLISIVERGVSVFRVLRKFENSSKVTLLVPLRLPST